MVISENCYLKKAVFVYFYVVFSQNFAIFCRKEVNLW